MNRSGVFFREKGDSLDIPLFRLPKKVFRELYRLRVRTLPELHPNDVTRLLIIFREGRDRDPITGQRFRKSLKPVHVSYFLPSLRIQ